MDESAARRWVLIGKWETCFTSGIEVAAIAPSNLHLHIHSQSPCLISWTLDLGMVQVRTAPYVHACVPFVVVVVVGFFYFQGVGGVIASEIMAMVRIITIIICCYPDV